MLQITGLLAISWLLVWLFNKGNLSVLGFTPTTARVKYFAVLFMISAACSALAFLLRMYLVKETYMISPGLTSWLVLTETWNQVRTVLTEELLCRGVLLYILIQKTGPNWAILISAIIFAVLHWLNAGVWGNLPQMAMIFAFTFAMGLLLAYAFAKTFSILIPFAIHMGWNLVQNYIFPDTPGGNHLFTLATPPPTVTISYLSFFTMLLLPKIALLLSDYLVIRKHPQVEIP